MSNEGMFTMKALEFTAVRRAGLVAIVVSMLFFGVSCGGQESGTGGVTGDAVHPGDVEGFFAST